MMRRSLNLAFLIVLLVGVPVAQAQSNPLPPPVSAALAAFNTYLTQPITADQLDSLQYTQGTFSDSALGCTLVQGVPLAAPVTAFRVQMVYQSVLYEFEVSSDATLVVPCTPALLAPVGPIVVATPVPATIGLTGCPVDFAGYLPPRLNAGGFARIGVEGVPNRLRTAPSVEGEQIGLIQPGTTVEVLDGPVCEPASQVVWWQVRDGDQIGYTAESQGADYYLEPVEFGLLPALPAVREPITADNAATLVTLGAVPFEGGAMLDFGGSGDLLVAGVNGVAYYDLPGQTVGSLPVPADAAVLHINYSPDGRYIAYSTDANALFVYDVADEATIELSLPEGAIINDLDFSIGGLLAVALGDPLGGAEPINGWSIYDLRDQSLVLAYNADSWVGDVAFGPAGLRLAWLDDQVHTVILQGDLPLLSGQIAQPTRSGLAWLPVEDTAAADAQFQLAYADGSVVQLFDVNTSELTSFTSEDDYLPGTLAFSADGSVLAVLNRAVSDAPTPRTLKLFDVSTGDLLESETLETARSMAFSPDGTVIAILTDNLLRFYGIASALDAAG
jgi:hypothetical protein